MGFKDDVQADLVANQYDNTEIAVSVVYNGVTISAYVEFGAGLELERRFKESVHEITNLNVLKSDVPQWRYRDKVVIDSKNWYVMGMLSASEFEWSLNITADERPLP